MVFLPQKLSTLTNNPSCGVTFGADPESDAYFASFAYFAWKVDF
jgi:hypothetical protein